MQAIDSVRQQVNALSWMHTIDLGNGIVTLGQWPPSKLILKALEQVDFRDKKVLDIGCWDGLWSFEAEKRGAREVYATDYTAHRHHQEMPTFALAKSVLNSKAQYYPDVSVFDLGRLGVSDFDIVLFCGVYYHLKDPLLALARLRQVMKPGGILVVEGEVLDNDRDSFARFFYRQPHVGDRSTWWVPTVACLREWVECNYFEIQNAYNVARDPIGSGKAEALKKMVKRGLGWRAKRSRCVLTAKAVCRDDANYPYPDEELARFQTEPPVAS